MYYIAIYPVNINNQHSTNLPQLVNSRKCWGEVVHAVSDVTEILTRVRGVEMEDKEVPLNQGLDTAVHHRAQLYSQPARRQGLLGFFLVLLVIVVGTIGDQNPILDKLISQEDLLGIQRTQWTITNGLCPRYLHRNRVLLMVLLHIASLLYVNVWSILKQTFQDFQGFLRVKEVLAGSQ